MSRKIIDRASTFNDKSVKNPWSWSWLELECGGAPLSEFIRKLEEPGKAICIWCNQDIKYGGRGKVALTDHAKTANHAKVLKLRKTNYSLPGKNKPPLHLGHRFAMKDHRNSWLYVTLYSGPLCSL